MPRKKKKGSVSVSKQEPEPMPPQVWGALDDKPEPVNWSEYKTHTDGYLKLANDFLESEPFGSPVPILGLARLPTDSAERKNIPLASGVLDYFPDALAAVAAVSKAGNDQHNPGEPLHWARGKSMDQGDTLIRHFIERGSVDVDGLRHSAKMAWRALALLQLEIEQEKGLPPSRGSR